MSTNSECVIIEVTPGAWFYLLQDYDAPRNSPDWREFATAYGPFDSEDAADEHLDRNHANPGGHDVQPLEAGSAGLDLADDEVLARLIAEARKPTRDWHGMRG